jgi:7,8-dihydropterin-6-yl-methyl-4-(beta-D-ribofuranosyl)aminobenzene 5'-phosphate synthase
MVKFTVITENTVQGKGDVLYGEHGFSLFLERPDIRILFDTGPAGIATLHNAPKLGIDLASADAIVLSHGHADHTGGLLGVLKSVGKPIRVYAHPGIFADRLSKRANGKIVFAGMPYKREALEGFGAEFDLSAGFREIAPDIYLTGEVPRRSTFETGDADLYVRRDAEMVKDPLPDDQSLVVSTSEGLALILGCCHAGLINTIRHVQQQLPGRPIHTVLGGTHLGFAPLEQLRETSRTLKGMGIRRLGLSHCTGLKAGAHLAAEFGEAVFFCNVATTLTLP